MTTRPRYACIAAALLMAACATSPVTARDRFAESDPFGDTAPHRLRTRTPAVHNLPPPPQAEIVTGYLPRNHNIPIYNEPPRLWRTP